MDKGEIIIYQTEDGISSLEVRLQEDTVWLAQKQIGVLFDKYTDTIGLHIRNIFKEGELPPGTTTKESSVVQEDSGRQVRRKTKYYNLDVVIFDQFAGILGRFRYAHCQVVHLISHHRKSCPCLTGARRFDGGVKRQ